MNQGCQSFPMCFITVRPRGILSFSLSAARSDITQMKRCCHCNSLSLSFPPYPRPTFRCFCPKATKSSCFDSHSCSQQALMCRSSCMLVLAHCSVLMQFPPDTALFLRIAQRSRVGNTTSSRHYQNHIPMYLLFRTCFSWQCKAI